MGEQFALNGKFTVTVKKLNHELLHSSCIWTWLTVVALKNFITLNPIEINKVQAVSFLGLQQRSSIFLLYFFNCNSVFLYKNRYNSDKFPCAQQLVCMCQKWKQYVQHSMSFSPNQLQVQQPYGILNCSQQVLHILRKHFTSNTLGKYFLSDFVSSIMTSFLNYVLLLLKVFRSIFLLRCDHGRQYHVKNKMYKNCL